MDGTRIGSFFNLKFNPNLDPNSIKFLKVDSIKYFAKNRMEIKFDTNDLEMIDISTIVIKSLVA